MTLCKIAPYRNSLTYLPTWAMPAAVTQCVVHESLYIVSDHDLRLYIAAKHQLFLAHRHLSSVFLFHSVSDTLIRRSCCKLTTNVLWAWISSRGGRKQLRYWPAHDFFVENMLSTSWSNVVWSRFCFLNFRLISIWFLKKNHRLDFIVDFSWLTFINFWSLHNLSLIHIWRCRRRG